VPIYIRPVRGQGDTLYVAMDDPMNEDALRECAASAGLPARPMIAAPSAILKAIRLYYGASASAPVPSRAAASAVAAPVPAAAAASSPQVAMPATATVRSRGEPLSPQVATPLASAVATPAVIVASAAPAAEAVAGDGVAPAPAAAPEPDSAPRTEEDGPVLEVREVEIPKQRKRAQIKLTLLDGTTIKVPSGRKRRADAAPEPRPTGPMPRKS
jgi:type IV pilus assembly protein PilB